MNKISLIVILLAISCSQSRLNSGTVVRPELVTDKVPHDTDDPAIWINPADPAESLVIGTDKDIEGGLYVFDLNGKLDTTRSIVGLKRPNNVDIEYGLMLNGKRTDIAVTTERVTRRLRIFSLPDMKAIDNGGIEMFEGETAEMFRDLMGIGLYKDPAGNIFAIVGRKTGPTDGTYLWQYLLKDDGNGNVVATAVRKFGNYSGKNEIEAIVVDDALGYVYYSDEGVGVRKYYADASKGSEELALFAQTGFAEDHEGLSIYPASDSTGFILVSDQGQNQFQVFSREGSRDNPHDHPLVKVVKVAAVHSDGSEITAVPLNERFNKGLFVVMSDDRTFHYYKPQHILDAIYDTCQIK